MGPREAGAQRGPAHLPAGRDGKLRLLTLVKEETDIAKDEVDSKSD
jgi:hypothetical protein